MSDDSRAERLRRRRQQQRDRSETGSERSEERSSLQSSSPESAADDDPSSVKDDHVGTYMYLPEDLKRELDFAFRELSLEYERAFEESFEKNRHFYPLVIRAGLDRVDELDETEIRERINELE